MERRREMNRKSAKTYYDKKKETDPEYVQKRREANAERMRKAYVKSEDLTGEALEEKRAKDREKMRRYREKKKAEKLALEAAAKAQEGKTE